MSEFDINADWDDDGLAGLGDAGADEPFSYDFDGGFAGLSDASFGEVGLDSGLDGLDGVDAEAGDAGDDGGYAELSEADAETDHTGDVELVDAGSDEGFEFEEFVEQLLERSFDTIGADPDEDGLWQQAVSDLHDDVNPYVAN